MNWLLIVVGSIFFICVMNGYQKGFIRLVISLGATVMTIMLANMMTPYVSDAIVTYTSIDEKIEEKCIQTLTPNLEGAELPRQKQIELLEAAKLPGFLKEGLIENNNIEAYKILNVTKFPEYVGAYLADQAVKMASFLVTFALVSIIMRIVITGANVIARLPVVNGLNRLAGGAAGFATALVIVWILFVVITLTYQTELGKQCLVWIYENEFLTYLYEKNLIMQFVTKL